MIRPPMEVQSAFVCEHAEDKNMILTLSTKTGEFEFAFAPATWAKLGEIARWFEALHASTNGVHRDEEDTQP